MRLYFAGAENKIAYSNLEDVGVDFILMSYYYLRNKKGHYNWNKIFLDSGGYSVRISKKKIDRQKYIDGYIKFIKDNNVPVYANLDMETYEETIQNQRYMESKGLLPIPVYHYSEFRLKKYRTIIDDYCKKYPMVALGGIAGANIPKKNIRIYLSYCFGIAKKYGTKLHGFGITDNKLLKIYPFFSVDSTSWQAGSRYGLFYQFIRGRIIQKNFFKKARRGTTDGKVIDRWNLVQWNKFAKHLEEKDEIQKIKNKYVKTKRI